MTAAGHVIAIGRPRNNALVRTLMGIDDDHGVVMVGRSPWSARHAALVVSGATDLAVSRAAAALARADASRSFSGRYAVVHGVGAGGPAPSDAGTTDALPAPNARFSAPLVLRWSAFGRGEEIRGAGQSAVSLTFDVGHAVPEDRPSLDLVYSFSPAMDLAKSSMRGVLNDVPLSTLTFEGSESSRQRARIELPPEALRVGLNTFSLRLSLYPRRPADFCAGGADEQAWAAIHSDTALTLPPPAARGPFTVGQYPHPFLLNGSTADAVMVVPDDLGQAGATVQIAADIGRYVRADAATLRMVTASQLDEQLRRDAHLLVYAPPGLNPLLREIEDALPLRYNDGAFVLRDGPESLLSFREGGRQGTLQTLRSPFNSARAILVVSANDPAAIPWAVGALRRGRLDGNVVLVNEPGPNDTTQVSIYRIGESAQRPAAESATGGEPVFDAVPIAIAAAVSMTLGLLLLMTLQVGRDGRTARSATTSTRRFGRKAPRWFRR